MDKNTLIERSFELSTDEQGTRTLFMFSRSEGEFGTILCTCMSDLNGTFMSARVADSAEPDAGYNFRLQEMLFFCTFILPLFNPLTHFKDGLSSFPQPLRSAPSQSDQ